MGFFDQIDNGIIDNAFKQFLNRTDREIFFTDIPQICTFHGSTL